MTRQRIVLQQLTPRTRTTTTRCPSTLQYHCSRIDGPWSAMTMALRGTTLSPPRIMIRSFGTSAFAEEPNTSREKSEIPLVQFSNAKLSYSEEDSTLLSSEQPYLNNFSILLPDWKDPESATRKDGSNNCRGGIAIVGENGSGKTLLGKAIIAAGAATRRDSIPSNPYVVSGSVAMPLRDHREKIASAASMKDRDLLGRAGRTTQRSSNSNNTAVAQVSFDSHRNILEEKDEKTGEIVTAFKAIASAGNAPGRLNPAARFLVIRFGLYPMLHRTVDTLSTGEIRKVLLARALSTKPSLLILDHAFDGLDGPSRKILRELVSKTIRGFTNDLLVQGVSSKDTADKTQVVMMAHRAEELDEIQELDTVAWWGKTNGSSNSNDEEEEPTWNVLRRASLVHDDNDRNDTKDFTWSSGKDVLHRAMGLNLPPQSPKDAAEEIDWEDPTLPSKENVREWWNNGLVPPNKNQTKNKNGDDLDEILVKARSLTVRKGDVTLLNNLSWTVRRGERWIVGGGNGAGKSTLSRLLALHPMASEARGNKHLQVLPDRDPGNPRATIGWVSTEIHMEQQKRDETSEGLASIRDVLLDYSKKASWDEAILPVLKWLGIFADSSDCLFERPFSTLSQGEQKMVLIAASLAVRPPLLVLDEPCQGLDLVNRMRLLQVVETICRSTDMALIYITHHLDEELTPSISHALHLKDRCAVYKGPIEGYSPEEYLRNGKT